MPDMSINPTSDSTQRSYVIVVLRLQINPAVGHGYAKNVLYSMRPDRAGEKAGRQTGMYVQGPGKW